MTEERELNGIVWERFSVEAAAAAIIEYEHLTCGFCTGLQRARTRHF